jgi:hypothetical protein
MRHNVTAVCLALALCALVSTFACDKNTVTQSESTNPTMYTLWGRVMEGGFPVPQATVEATASWGTGGALMWQQAELSET